MIKDFDQYSCDLVLKIYWQNFAEVPANVIQQLAPLQHQNIAPAKPPDNQVSQQTNGNDPNYRAMDLACNQAPCRKDPPGTDSA